MFFLFLILNINCFYLVVIDNIGDLCLFCFRNCFRCGLSISRWRIRIGISFWIACGLSLRFFLVSIRLISWLLVSLKRLGLFSLFNYVLEFVMCCMILLC